MSTSEAAARKEGDPTMEEREEEGMGELGEGGGGQNEMDRGITISRSPEFASTHHLQQGGGDRASALPQSPEVRMRALKKKKVMLKESVDRELEGLGGEHSKGDGRFSGDRGSTLPWIPEVGMAVLNKKEKVMLKEMDVGVVLSRSSVVSFAAAAAAASKESAVEVHRPNCANLCCHPKVPLPPSHGKPVPPLLQVAGVQAQDFVRSSRPWMDKRQRSARARLCGLLPKPSKVGFDSMVSQAAEIIQERRGTTHNLEGLDGVAKLKKVLPEAGHLTGKDSLLNAAADFLERHPDKSGL